MTDEILDLAGIGIGPFNLSIAALLTEAPGIDARFYEAKPTFGWHPGMMLPGVRLQTSPLKDLVTAVAPTSPYSFLNYLVQKGRFYQFLHAELPAITRREFEDYLAWVADRLDTLRFGQRIEAVTADDQAFTIHRSRGRDPVRARNIILGTGRRPKVPGFAQGKLDEQRFHNASIANRDLDLEDHRVAIVGGGQSGAEVLEAILSGHWGTPAALYWLSRRPHPQPLDEVAFTNEYFTPGYVDAFHPLDPDRKARKVEEQKLASDGISPATLRALYRRLYEAKAMGDLDHPVRLLPGREVVDMDGQTVTRLTAVNHLTGRTERYEVDVAVFCTGYEASLPACLDPIAHRLHQGDHQPFCVDRRFRVGWDGPDHLGIYAVNAGRYSHGIAEPQLSLMAWRSATIINDLVGREVFDLAPGMELVSWTEPGSQAGTDRASGEQGPVPRPLAHPSRSLTGPSPR